MFKKNQNTYVSPNLDKMQEVVIDFRTKIYIALDADPVEAKKRYLSKHGKRIL